jgi:hypothetical protein
MLAANRGRHTNPKRRSKRRASARRSNPIGIRRISRPVRHSKRRRNPISLGGMAGGITGMMMNGLKGAGGAIAVNVITNYLPPAVKTGNTVYITRTAIALVLGTVGRKVLGNSARAMAEGALTVNFHDFINSMAGALLPGSTMHGVGQYMAGASALSRNLPGAPTGSGQYVDSELNGLGEYMYAR